MLRLTFQCKACGREHRVPRDFRNRWVDSSRGGSGGEDEKVYVFTCELGEETRRYARNEIRWAERGEG